MTEQFIENAIEVHGDKYDYSKVIYKNCDTKIIITCKEHGEFLQTPYKHLLPQGCRKCGNNRTSNQQRDTKEKFISKSIIIHGESYDYSKVEYKNSRIKVIIICKEHGEYLQQPYNHLQGNGCPNCRLDIMGKWNKSNKEDFQALLEATSKLRKE
jgi:hypothetical protein